MSKQSSSYISVGAGHALAAPTHINWKNVDVASDEGRAKLSEAITDYLREVQVASKSLALKTTQTGHMGNLPTTPDVSVNFWAPRLDTNITSVFRGVDRTSSKNPVFEFANVSANAIVFEQHQEGAPVKLRTVKDSAAASLKVAMFHGGLGISDRAKRFDEYDVYEENIRRVPAAWENHWANNIATLVAALGAGIDQAAGATLIDTLNAAAVKIFDDVGDTYSLTDSEELVIVYNWADASKMTQAFSSHLTLPNDNNSKSQLEFNFSALKTRRVPAGTAYICLPGYDNVDVTWTEMYSEYGRDFTRGQDAQVWRTMRNAGIGNVQQWRRITL